MPLVKANAIAPEESILLALKNSTLVDADMARSLASSTGTGSLLDLPINVAKSLPYVKKKFPTERYEKGLNTYQNKLIDLDRKGGEALAKGKILNHIFTAQDLVPSAHVITDSGKSVPAYVPHEVKRLTAPLDKVKRIAVPVLAVYGLQNILENNSKSSNRQKEGEVSVREASESTIRRALISKISSVLENINSTESTPPKGLEKTAIVKIKQAAELLKTASIKINSLEDKVASLSEDNKRLELTILAKERSGRAVKLANDMVRKGMSKRADLESQVDYIMGLNDDSYNILRDTVDSVQIKQSSNEDRGVDKLSFLLPDGDNNTPDKTSFQDAIIGLLK